jgi:hypothetical protein
MYALKKSLSTNKPMNNLYEITQQANLIIADRHDVSDPSDQFKLFRRGLYAYLDIEESAVDWVDLIEMPELPNDLRQVLIRLDDTLDLHNTTRYVL